MLKLTELKLCQLCSAMRKEFSSLIRETVAGHSNTALAKGLTHTHYDSIFKREKKKLIKSNIV